MHHSKRKQNNLNKLKLDYNIYYLDFENKKIFPCIFFFFYKKCFVVLIYVDYITRVLVYLHLYLKRDSDL